MTVLSVVRLWLAISQPDLDEWSETRLANGSSAISENNHSYIFHKEGLTQWRTQRLTFREAMQHLAISKATLHTWIKEKKIEVLDDMGEKQRWFSQQVIQ